LLCNTLDSGSAVSNSEFGASGNPYDITFIPGGFDYAVDFGTAGYVYFNIWPQNSQVWGTSQFTIQFWAKPDTLSQYDAFVFDFVKGFNDANQQGYLRLIQLTSTTLALWLCSTQPQYVYNWDNTQFHHFAYSVGTNAITVYIDGVPFCSSQISAEVIGTSVPYELVLGDEWHLGTDGYGVEYHWSGAICDLKIYNYAKTNFNDRFQE
jgi:hypothetical protein